MQTTKKEALIFLLFLVIVLPLLFATVLPISATAQTESDLWGMQEGKDNIPEAFNYPSGSKPTDVRDIIVRVIRLFLGFVALIFVIMVIIGGYHWMTAGSNEDKINRAKKTIIAGIIGFFIIFMAYALTYFLVVETYKEIIQ